MSMESSKKQKTDSRREIHTSSASFSALPQTIVERVASFLPPTIESVQTFAQISRVTHQATAPARAQIASLGLTGKATVGDQHLYTRNPEGDTRFYFPTALSGQTEQFPHITRRPEVQHTPHLTDVATIHHDSMPNSLPAGNYPTRHRYDVQPGRTLSPVILPQSNKDKGTGTLAKVDSSAGLSPMHYVASRYKAKVDAKQKVPEPGKPLELTSAQTTVGGNPQHWEGAPVKFYKK
jgi:hypothetical protein